MATSQTGLTADDWVAIVELTNRFNFDIDNWRLDDVLAAFTDDGVMDHPAGRGEGRDGVRTFFEGYRPETRGVRHQSLNHVVTATGDAAARMESTLVVLRVAEADGAPLLSDSPRVASSPSFPFVLAVALVTDEVRRVGGGWKFARRIVGRVVARQ